MTAQTFDSFLTELAKDREFAEQQAEFKPSRDVAMLLAQIRHTLGLSQKEFARRAGVSQAYVASLESGAANPSIRVLSRLLRKNGVALRLEATITAKPDIDGQVQAQVRERVHWNTVGEGEMAHVLTAAQGVAAAIAQSRVDEVPLTKERVLSEIAAAYEANFVSPRH